MNWKNFVEENAKQLKYVKIITPKINNDNGCDYFTLYDSNVYKHFGLDRLNVRNKIVHCKKDIKKDFHWDEDCWKLITCISGKIEIEVIYVCDQLSNCEKFILDDELKQQILIPPYHANSYKALRDSIVNYHIFYDKDDFDLIKQYKYE